MISIYQIVKGSWQVVRYGCPNCEKSYKNIEYAVKHIEKCNINTNKQKEKQLLKELKDMPIQRVMNNGVAYYRKGSEGRLYKTIKEAESVGSSTKKKGADGKACWEGYRYAGTTNGQDKCVKVKGR